MDGTMKRVLVALSGGLLLLFVVSLAVAVYLYLSLTPTSTSIVRRAESAVPSPVLPPKPVGATVDVEVQPAKRACFDFPAVKGLQVYMSKACTDLVPAIHAQKALDPTDEQLRAWASAVDKVQAAHAAAVEKEAQRIADVERERMRKEIEFWSTVIAGPAPILVALSGFLVTLLLQTRKKRPPSARRQ
jgi:hypothetical protein